MPNPDTTITIFGYSFILAVDNQAENNEKKTYLNIEYQVNDQFFRERIPMHKDEFAEIRSNLNESRVIELLRRKHS